MNCVPNVTCGKYDGVCGDTSLHYLELCTVLVWSYMGCELSSTKAGSLQARIKPGCMQGALRHSPKCVMMTPIHARDPDVCYSSTPHCEYWCFVARDALFQKVWQLPNAILLELCP